MSATTDILFYQSPDGHAQLRVQLQNDTMWLTQAQMAELFDVSKKTISEHIQNLFREGELQADSVVRKSRTTAADGKYYQVQHYNLDVIISVGYRVKSLRGTQFRQWATQVLRQYLVQGCAKQNRVKPRATTRRNEAGDLSASRAVLKPGKQMLVMMYFKSSMDMLQLYRSKSV